MACGAEFIYNRIPSELYGVSIVFLNESYTNRPSGSGVEIITDAIKRNAEVVQVGSQQAPPLEFGIEVVFDEAVDIFVLTQVKDWLGGEVKFRELQICVDNFNTFYFNCYIVLKEDLIYGDGYRGVSATVKCDSPWAWEFETEEPFTLDSTKNNTIYFNNLSADTELLKPILEFTMVRAGDFSITNVETGLTTEFTGLLSGETIKIDNKLGFIESSLGLKRIGNFNKIFLKLIKGTNELLCSPNVTSMKLTFKNAKRIGGGFY